MGTAEITVKNYLKRNGICHEREIQEILSGFDLSKPVYEQSIGAGDKLFQFVRNASSSVNELRTGRWFALKGASMDALGIFSGISGRQLTEFRVKQSINVLEGTAKALSRNWDWAGGGQGGATQIFIPQKLFYALEAFGAHLT